MGDAVRSVARGGQAQQVGPQRDLDQRRQQQRRDRHRDGRERRREQLVPLVAAAGDEPRRERDEERRQLEQNMKSWERRLVEFDEQLEGEPQRLVDFYAVKARRVEPVGLVYLWPDTN